MQRGSPRFGGVPGTEHPGKIIIRNIYAHSKIEAQEAIRGSVIKAFSIDTSVPCLANQYFEKWIDVIEHHGGFLDDKKQEFKEYTAYLYLTKTEYVQRIVTLLNNPCHKL